MKGTRWILVADSAQARIYDFVDGELTLQETLERPQSREHSRDLMGNRPNQNQHQMEKDLKGNESQSLRDDESRVFAREVCQVLSKAHATNRFRELVMVADPRFLGLLRAHLSRPVAAVVAGTIDKHALQMKDRELTALMEQRID